MKKTIFTFLLLIPICIFAQQRKIYKGQYVFPNGSSGYVEYEYFETERGRVFDGSYNDGYAEGNFKNGLKDGIWTFNKTQKRTYFKGKLNGLLEAREYRTALEIRNVNVKIMYENNRFSGSFSIGDYTGQFDSNGYANGEWIAHGTSNYTGVRYIRKQKWEHGYLIDLS